MEKVVDKLMYSYVVFSRPYFVKLKLGEITRTTVVCIKTFCPTNINNTPSESHML